MNRVAASVVALWAAVTPLQTGKVQPDRVTFFVTSESPGKGGDLGGIAGADAHCQKLAKAAGSGSRTWHAYLSAPSSGSTRAVSARDRIGSGPWTNALGVQVASSLAQLHSVTNKLSRGTSVDERGRVIPSNRHDILTGSGTDGRLSTAASDTTCHGWTSAGAGRAMVGHQDKQEGPSSWNSAHLSPGCGQLQLQSSGGAGLLYCFAVN